MHNGIELPLHKNLIYFPSPTATLGQSLRAIWDAASQAATFILFQIKFNSKLSSCACILVNSPLDFKEVKSVNPKGNKTRMFIEKTDAEAEAPTLWPPDSKSWLIGKAPDAGKDWRWEEKGTTEDEMVG